MGEQWGLSVIRAPEAWGAGIGAGITIAVVDTGVDFGHQDLNVGAKLLPGRNILNPDSSAQDDNGHGTHVAGIAAAATGNGVGIAGTAPGASILPVKVLRADGSGYASDVATGIRWAAGEGASAPRAQVINLSLGSDLPPLTALFGSGLEKAIDYAWSRDVVVVLAAGNSFLFASSSGQTPAIVVTATNRQDERPSYASAVGSARWGMAAPGGSRSYNSGGIMSTHWKNGSPNSYEYLAGTSMSAPHVAGAAAVLLAQGLNPSQTIDRLLGTAKDIGDPGRDSVFGHGRLDLGCAAGRCAIPATTTTAATTATTRPADAGSGGSQPSGSSGSGSSGTGGSGSAPAPTGSSGGSTGSSPSGGTGEAPPSPAGSTTGGGRTGTSRPSGLAGRFRSPATPAPPSADPAGAVPGDAVPPEQLGVEAPSELGEAEETPGRPLEAIELAKPSGVEKRPDPALTTAAAGLLLLLSFAALRRRRRQPE